MRRSHGAEDERAQNAAAETSDPGGVQGPLPFH